VRFGVQSRGVCGKVALFALWVALVGAALPREAAASPEIPRLTGPLIDNANMLDPADQARVSSRLSDMFASGGPQMQVWTFPSLEGDDIAPVGIRAAEAWKLGRAGRDDGIILLIAARERRTRLEVGRGLEGVVPDILAGRLLQDVLRPALRAGRTADGILAVAGAVEAAARGELPPLPPASKAARGDSGESRSSWLAYVLPLLFIAGTLLSRGGRSRKGQRRGGGFVVFPGLGGGGGFGGGRGGWSGGGGSFGGGGSSGDW
jgi:uncharacterized protein